MSEFITAKEAAMTDPSNRQLATIRTVTAIEKIPDADAIETAVIGAWRVVTKIGEFQAGDRCLYLEIDSLLPLDDPRFEFLRPRGVHVAPDGKEHHRLKTARLRGVYSQGLALPESCISPAEFDADDLSEALGVLKYEPPLPSGSGIQSGAFPTHLVPKTDAERAQNLAAIWSSIADEQWYATEKIDGMSCTVIRELDGTVRVCGRNWEITEGDNVYWAAARTTGLIDAVPPGCAVQAEIYGEGVQGNPLKVRGKHVAVFKVWDVTTMTETARGAWPLGLRYRAVPVYPNIGLGDTADETLAAIDGIRSIISPDRLAEGVVWHHVDATAFPALGYRSCFKTISNKYLLKHQ